jgi:hypothetical protein
MTVSVVTGLLACAFAQFGSFDMSIGFWWGGVPSSLIVPVIPPVAAALTLSVLRVEYQRPTPSMNSAQAITANFL